MPETPTPTPSSHTEFTLKRRRRWPWIAGAVVILIGAAAIVVVPHLTPAHAAESRKGATLYVATAEGNASEEALINFIEAKVAPKYGIHIAFKGLADSNTINAAVNDGEVAGTIYQHKLWLGQVLQANPTFRETAATPVFRWGFGLWSSKWKSVRDIPDGATVSLYSDPANEAQGLWILERAGLITLKSGIDKGTATQADVVSNPRHLTFSLLDFAAQSRALPSLDAAVGYTEYYLAAGINQSDEIYAPAAPDEFAGQLTVGTRYLRTANVQKLIAAFKDPAVQRYLATNSSVKGILLPLDAR